MVETSPLQFPQQAESGAGENVVKAPDYVRSPTHLLWSGCDMYGRGIIVSAILFLVAVLFAWSGYQIWKRRFNLDILPPRAPARRNATGVGNTTKH